MKHSSRAFLSLLVLITAARCSKDEPTQIVLVVDSDLRVPAELAAVEVAAWLQGNERFRQSYELSQGNPAVKLPLVLGFVSPEHRPDTVRIEVSGRSPAAGSLPIVSRAATMQFLPHKILRLDLPLLARCEGVVCDPGSTCFDDGLCASEMVTSGTLPAFTRASYPTMSMYAPASRDAAIDAPAAPTDGGGAVPTCAESCIDGRCYGDVCCRGCWDGTSCRTGQEIAACGAGGAACETCDDGNVCTTDSCVAGRCGRMNASGVCPTGTCVDGACKCGSSGQPCCESGERCVSGLACTAAGADEVCGACGAVGQPCCPGGTRCSTGVCDSGTSRCVACGARGEPCCGSNTCNTGLACAGTTCACGAVGQPCCSGNVCSQVGTTCTGSACVACGGKDQPCCGGNVCGVSLACAQGTCRCGSKGEPCCGGTACTSGLACNTSKVCGCATGVPDCGGVCRPGLACCPGSTGGSCGQCGTHRCNTSGQWECQGEHGNCNSPGSVICIGGTAGCPCPAGTRQECDTTCNKSGCF